MSAAIPAFHPIRPRIAPPRRSAPVDPPKEEKPKAEPDFLATYGGKAQKKAQKPGSLGAKTTAIPSSLVKGFADPQSMLLLHELGSIATKACSLLGPNDSNALQAVPILNLVTAPYCLYQSATQSSDRFSLVKDAVKIGNVSDAFFWGFKGVDSIGNAISNITKGFSGGFAIGNVAQSVMTGFLFTCIIPILLIVAGVIGGIAEAWSLYRNDEARQSLNKRIQGKRNDTQALVETLEFLQGKHHIKPIDGKDDPASRLDFTNFKTTHFSSDERFEAVKAKVESTLNDKRAELRQELALMHDIQGLFQGIFENQRDELTQIDQILKNYETAKKMIPTGNELLLETMNSNIKKLNDFKALFLKEGNEIVDTVRSEIHRNILYNAIFLLIVAVVLASGILYQMSPNNTMVSSYLCIASSLIYISYIIFDKKISQAQFLRLERSLGIINVGLTHEPA